MSTPILFVMSNFYDGPPFILEVAVFKCARTCLDTPYTWESNPQYATNALTPYTKLTLNLAHENIP